MRNDWRARSHAGWWAFLVHRVSGILLTLFLPLHFLALGLALEGEAALDAALRWTEQPLVKAAEVVLVVLLAAHAAGGIRLLMLEFLPWREWHKTLLAVAGGVTLAVGVGFLLNLV
ncbi:MAG: succinate dehydrogenase [Burkholderiales bacterium]|nr:succinate dehydrogenase [Burkholderiales bacterium]